MTNATRGLRRALGILAIAATGLVGFGAATAHADRDDWRWEREHDWRWERHHDWRRYEWERHHRAYYGPVYVTPPPPVYYVPPPPPRGLNLYFHVR